MVQELPGLRQAPQGPSTVLTLPSSFSNVHPKWFAPNYTHVRIPSQSVGFQRLASSAPSHLLSTSSPAFCGPESGVILNIHTLE